MGLDKKYSEPWKNEIIRWEKLAITSNSRLTKLPNILPKNEDKTSSARCVRDNLAGIRGNVNPKYAARIDNGEIEQQFVKFYSKKSFLQKKQEKCVQLLL